MPLYLITHVAPLSDAQQDQVAEAITKIHTELFNAPRLFVNVHFSPARHVGYVGGRRSARNSIAAHVRHGPSRTQEMYDVLTERVVGAWAEAVPDDSDIGIFVLGDIVAGREHGFPVPPAGKDGEWLKENYAAFEAKAQAGNQDMEDLIEDIRARKMLG